MNENDEDVVHAGIVSKSQKLPEFRPILEFATSHQVVSIHTDTTGEVFAHHTANKK